MLYNSFIAKHFNAINLAFNEACEQPYKKFTFLLILSGF